VTGTKNIKILLVVAVMAVALVGCSSNSTTTAPTVPVDTAPPAVPTSLDGQSYANEVTVSWAANTTDADLDGYRVYRVSGERVAELTSAPQSATAYTDNAPEMGSNTYRVTSVDVNGNESAYQSVSVTVEDGFGPYHPDQP
jgi:type IV pilus biogenesis protein CpaD/CtpE